LRDAKNYLKEKTEKGKSAKCPCCNQLVAVYKRRINANAARALILIFNHSGYKTKMEIGNNLGPFLHIQQVFAQEGLRATAMDYIQLSRFGLIEKSKEKAADGKKDSGMWRITRNGVMFCLGYLSIPEYVLVYDNKNIGASDKLVKINQCLKNKFDYKEILNRDYLQYATV
jgi:hypothetical protein